MFVSSECVEVQGDIIRLFMILYDFSLTVKAAPYERVIMTGQP